MATALLLPIPSSSSLIITNHTFHSNNNLLSAKTSSSRFTRSGATGGGRYRFDRENDLRSGGDGFDDESEFRGGRKPRVWWTDEEEDDDTETDEDEEFWIQKLLGAFGWMVPAIGLSFLVGTGSNAFLMALAVPLGQSLVSLVIDRVWNRTSSNMRSRPRTRTRTRRRPYSGAAAATNIKTGEVKQKENVRQQSSRSANVGSYDTGDRSRFGGWDELDKRKETQKVTSDSSDEKINISMKGEKKRKLSRIGRIRDRPLLLRLLIAVFPFLGSWSKLLL